LRTCGASSAPPPCGAGRDTVSAGRGVIMEERKNAQEIYQELRHMIMNFVIMPGTRVTESQLADYFEVSRTPVRSALQRLDSEGLLEIKSKQGCFIRSIDIVKISHYYDVRVALEKAVVDEVLRQNPRALVAALAEKWHPESRRFGTEATEELKLAEEEFHMELAHASGNEALVKYLRDVNDNIRAVRRLGWPSKSSVVDTYEEHFLICQLILERKAAQARREMENHIRKSHDGANRVTLNQLYGKRDAVNF
jgi:DNA-binding GntR family transcriptional regulator